MMNTNTTIRTLSMALASLAFLILPRGILQASIVADFTAGNTTGQVDGWTGKPGYGWVTAWSTAANAGATVSASVESTAPLYAGGGNYLSGSVGREGIVTRSLSGVVGRQYSDYGGVSLSSAHSLSFYYRLDGGLDDLEMIVLSNDNSRQLAPTAGSNWAARHDLNNSGWRLSTINSSGVNAYRASNVRIYEGDVYFFQYDFDPANGTYEVTVTNLDYTVHQREDGVASYSATLSLQALGEDSLALGGYLNFAHRIHQGGESGNVQFSLDSITIVPEPGAAAMFGGVIALLGVLLLRQRKVVSR